MKNHSKHSSVILNKADNVAMALRDLRKGELSRGVKLQENIKSGFKFSLKEVKQNEDCIKYGNKIGSFNKNIEAGYSIHVHNLNFEYTPNIHVSKPVKTNNLNQKKEKLYFEGYKRESGEIGTRNFIGIISTVNCTNTVVDGIVNHFKFLSGSKTLEHINRETRRIDGVVPIKHTLGCAIQKEGVGHKILERTLNGYINHPNFCLVLLVGLGCEVTNIASLLQNQKTNRVYPLEIQKTGGTKSTIEEGISTINNFINNSALPKRESLNVSNLRVSLQCGASDAYSGITANPVLGSAMDLLISHGGTAVLGETPEIYGAEHLLKARAVSLEIIKKLEKKIEWWEDYVRNLGDSLSSNPSPGNIEGGITNIVEKSLGAVAKSGSSPLVDVIDYAEKIKKNGFIFMDTPGYDPVSVTGHIAGGCNIVCFTTGRGSVFGSIPAPTIKISSNTALFNNQLEDIDFNAGELLTKGKSQNDLASDLLNEITLVASGKITKSENFGYGYNEFVPWQLGAVL